MDKEVKIGLIVSAYDQASNVLEKVFGKSKKNFAELKEAAVDFGKGTALISAGMAGLKLLQQPVEAFAKMQEAGNDLKGAMMGPGGVLDADTYKKIASMSMDLSDKYKGSATDYIEMVKVLKQNRIDETDILGGIGEATAKLSDLFDMAPAQIAEFSAHMKNDMGVAVGDMGKVMDLVARVHGSGVGKTGSEAVTEMNEFFSKASLGAANLGVQGVEATKQLGALGALFMSRGLGGATVGTNFRRIFDSLADPERIAKVNAAASVFGKHLQLYKDGKFLGMDNFVQELGKLHDLTGQQIAQIFRAFGGKQGLSTDFIQNLSKFGLTGYDEFLKKMDGQAEMSDKLGVKMKGLAYQQEVFRTSTENLEASLGAALAPTLTTIYEILNEIVSRIRAFVETHPHIAKMATAFIAVASGLAMLWGGVKVFQALTLVAEVFGLALDTIPVIGWINLIIVGLAALYAYWDDITAFFKSSTIQWGAVFMNIGKVIYNAVLWFMLWPLKAVLSTVGAIGKALGLHSLQNAADSANATIDKLFAHYDSMTKPNQGQATANAARAGLYVPKAQGKTGDAVSGLVNSNDRSTVNNHVTVNVSGGATAADARVVSDSVQNTFDKLMRDHEQRKARRSF